MAASAEEIIDQSGPCSILDTPEVLYGHDSPAAASLRLFQMCVGSMNGGRESVKSDGSDPHATAYVHFDLSMYDPESSRRLPNPAPPPKLHYSTFWRSVTRRIYQKRAREAMQLARESSPVFGNKTSI
jgi:hypothetical protein